MPLFLRKETELVQFNGNCLDDLLFLIQTPDFAYLSEEVKQFQDIPIQTIDHSNGLVYVFQQEMAVSIKEDKNIEYIGSEDATTCHIVILKNTNSGAVAVAHLDGQGRKTAAQVSQIVTEVRALSSNSVEDYELHIFGGFNDDNFTSGELSDDLLKCFSKCEEKIVLKTVCMTPLNTCLKDGISFPVVYGVAVNVKTGEIFPATFPDKGPDSDVRSERNGYAGTLLSVYNCKTGEICIPPFRFQPMPQAELWLTAPDHIILRYLSTSPKQEREDFVTNVRRNIKYCMENKCEDIFRNNKPRVHTIISNGEWKSHQ